MTEDSGDKTEERAQAWGGALEDDLTQVDEADNDDDQSKKSEEETQDSKDTMETEDTMDTTASESVTDTQGEQDAQGTDAETGSERSEWDVDSISSAWQANQVRLPESIQGPFNTEHKRLDFELEQLDTDVNYSKDRYYKPLVVALGLRELEDTDAEEIADLLDELERRNLLD
ncbi:hypothetical protein EKH57_00225 (plasmid) [Halorubrum sp. BOL3-1]|uniref:hypothetical protein n=1 Tax=Halorubrum sp. BOL3-1 TaxID=2497325 RepID=UPI001005019C|nr:hypothetical protein [Halorubrum sp. BOL3-1]QAU11351.1 hypothetical protein EKH57_00225 [Halorubrum sp. BOL3-1]